MRKTFRPATARQPILLKADRFYAPIIALAVSLHP